MEYLRGNATASATGLFVICRHLGNIEAGQAHDELQRALQPLRLQPTETADGNVLATSLKVGEGLGIIQRDVKSDTWTVNALLGQALQAREQPWNWFRGELLHRMSLHAVQELTASGKVPDLLVGLTWFLQCNPLRPIPYQWGLGPERALNDLGLRAIDRSEQWLPFRRWIVALGLARRVDAGKAKVIIPDATTAIADQLSYLPANGNAREWLSALRARVPVFGASELLGQLPQGGAMWTELPPAVSLGLLKLEKSGVLTLEAADDDHNIVTVGLSESPRQVGRITIEERKP